MDKFWVAVAATVIGVGLNVLVKVLDVTPGVKRLFVGVGILLIVVGVGIFGVFALGMSGVRFRSPIFFGDNKSQPDIAAMKSWGSDETQGRLRLRVEVNGSKLLSYQSDYRVAVIAFRWDEVEEPLDVLHLQKSQLYDIRNNSMVIFIDPDDWFLQRYMSGKRTTNYFLLLVPRDVQMGQFSTRRQARALGVIEVTYSAGPP